jgi:uncharacterized protein YllA (UPF0747 family)
MEFAELVELAGQRITELKAVISEGSSLLSELQRVEKIIDIKLAKDVDKVFAERLNETIKEGLDEYSASLDEAIRCATQAVFDRFDTIMTELLGEDIRSQKKGKKSIPDLLLQRRQSQSAVIDDVVERTLRKR